MIKDVYNITTSLFLTFHLGLMALNTSVKGFFGPTINTLFFLKELMPHFLDYKEHHFDVVNYTAVPLLVVFAPIKLCAFVLFVLLALWLGVPQINVSFALLQFLP